jgi:UDP-N-acetylglucosamine acyltransferase
MSTQFHPTAIVSPKAKIADNVIIGPFVHIHDDVVIDEGTEIMNGAVIAKGARIGKNCIIHPYAIISNVPQDLKFTDIDSTAEIGDNTTIREFVTVHRGTEARKRSTIGKNCFIMAYAHIAHDCIIGDSVIIANSVHMGGHCSIGDFTNVGGLTAIHQFSKIGSYCMVGGTSRVRKDIPPYALVSDDPVAFMKINMIGLRRRGFTPEVLRIIEETYNIIYFSKMNVTQALKKLKESDNIIPEVQSIISFIESSDRGIVRACGSR